MPVLKAAHADLRREAETWLRDEQGLCWRWNAARRAGRSPPDSHASSSGTSISKDWPW
jgi:hypothetical protein